MTDISDPEEFDFQQGDLEDMAASAEAKKTAWQATLDELELLADEYEEKGWEVASIAALELTPKPSSAGDDDRWGLIHLIADNDVTEFLRAFQLGEFPTYQVYRQQVEGDVFLVTELTDPDAEAAILLAGGYTGMDATALVEETKEEGQVFTHVRTLDGTQYGSFRHEKPEKFFPRYGEFGSRYGMEHGLDDEE